MKFEETARRSGRTSRMMQEAKRLDAEGKAVYVVFSTQEECYRWRDFVEGTGIKLETHRSIGGDRFTEDIIIRGRIRGQHENAVLLIDHHLIFERYGPFISTYHRWDKEES